MRLRIRQASWPSRPARPGLTVAARSVELARRGGRARAPADGQQRERRAAALVRSQAALLDAELRLLAARHARELARVDLAVALGGTHVNPDEVSP
ncbi:MAG: hypothetical protein IPH72_32825 [Sandaracinaceae bacterium]|nr:hypothetical protein [Sandaracinaceae bacterium]